MTLRAVIGKLIDAASRTAEYNDSLSLTSSLTLQRQQQQQLSSAPRYRRLYARVSWPHQTHVCKLFLETDVTETNTAHNKHVYKVALILNACRWLRVRFI